MLIEEQWVFIPVESLCRLHFQSTEEAFIENENDSTNLRFGNSFFFSLFFFFFVIFQWKLGHRPKRFYFNFRSNWIETTLPFPSWIESDLQNKTNKRRLPPFLSSEWLFYEWINDANFRMLCQKCFLSLAFASAVNPFRFGKSCSRKSPKILGNQWKHWNKNKKWKIIMITYLLFEGLRFG